MERTRARVAAQGLIKDSRAYPDYSAQRLVAGAFTAVMPSTANLLVAATENIS